LKIPVSPVQIWILALSRIFNILHTIEVVSFYNFNYFISEGMFKAINAAFKSP
jgi:hypothetical protein